MTAAAQWRASVHGANSAILLVPPLPHVLHPKAVADPHPARASLEKEDKRTFLQKIAEFIHPGPDSKAELIETLADAEDNDIIGAESRVMLEGVIRMAELTAGDVMVAAPRMDLLNIDSPLRRHAGPRHRHRALALSRSTRAIARTSSASCWPRTCSSCSARLG